MFAAAGIASAQRPGGFGGANFNRGGQNFGRGGNQSSGSVNGKVMLTPETPDAEPEGAEGAVVIISFEKRANNLANVAAKKAAGEQAIIDSVYAVIGASGSFFLRSVPVGPATLKVSLMGYEKIERNISISPGQNPMEIYLKPEDLTLTQSVVTAKVPPLSIVADTIVMNAAAVKYNKGEMAIDIIEQMPGVEATSTGVTVLGEAVSNVYVDGVLLFGNSPMSALNNLPAEEVVSIKSFQEYANKDPRHKISQNESKERVLDISTKTKANMVINGNVLVGGGFDTDTTYHKFRYTTGATVSMSSEKLQVNASVNANNINSAANRIRGAVFGAAMSGGGSPDLKSFDVSISATKKWMHKKVKNYVLGQINGSYSYRSSYNVNESRSEQIYFPKEGLYDARKQLSSSRSISESGNHSFSVGATKNIPDGSIRLNGSFSINDGLSESYSSNYTYQMDPGAPAYGPRQGTSSSNIRNSDGKSYSVSLNVNKGFWNVLRVGLSASAGQSSSDALTTKIDTTTQTISYKELEITTSNPSRNLSVSPNVRLEISDRQSVDFSYSYRQTYNQTEQIAYNLLDNRSIDEINTNTMTNDNYTHTMQLGYSNALWKEGPILRANVSYNSVRLAKEEHYPRNGEEIYDPYDHAFNSWSPSISIGTEGLMNRWSIRYSSSTSTPSLEQVRPRINNTDLYHVRGGNPNLKQSRSHSINASFSTPLGDFESSTMSQSISTISVNASFRLNQNRIASNVIYFAKEGTLADYGYPEYVMPATSSFTTYVNVPDGYSANASVRYDTELKFIRCNLNTNVSMSWDNTPEFINNVLTRTTNYSPNVSLGLRSNFSRNVRFNLNGRGSYIYSINTLNNSKDYFTESITAGAEVNNILKKGYVSGNYTKTFMQGVDQNYKGINDNILDLSAGLRFGPRNNVDLSVMIHDLFNKTSGFTSSMNNDYISNRWVHNFGRSVMFRLSYSFNTRRSTTGGGRGSAPAGGPMGGGFPGGFPMGGFPGGRR